MTIVYVGNAVVDTTHTKNIIEKACRYTHVDKQKLYEQMNKCEYVDTAIGFGAQTARRTNKQLHTNFKGVGD